MHRSLALSSLSLCLSLVPSLYLALSRPLALVQFTLVKALSFRDETVSRITRAIAVVDVTVDTTCVYDQHCTLRSVEREHEESTFGKKGDGHVQTRNTLIGKYRGRRDDNLPLHRV